MELISPVPPIKTPANIGGFGERFLRDAMTPSRLFKNLTKRLRFRKEGGGIQGLALGVEKSRDPRRRAIIVLSPTMRSQHIGILGLSGSGKTHFIEHLVRQDIQKKNGFVLFDVHGDLSDSVVSYLTEQTSVDPEIAKRTVLLEPFNPERSFGFNPLEEQRGISAFLQAQEFAHILRVRWRDENLGPRTEELLRNSLYTLCVNGRTLLDLPHLLTNKSVRRIWGGPLLPAIKRYWADRYDALSGRMQALFREPLLTRISSFVDDPIIRDIVGQRKSTFSFRKAFDESRWIVINLSKGRLGANSQILGSLLFAKLELEVMSLADVPAARRRLFSVYADELQNLAGSTFGRLVAEARKYNIALVAGHQFWKQLAPPFREAMLAVGTKVLFRLHYHDAVELAGELCAAERNRYISLLTGLERGEAIVRIANQRPIRIAVPAHQQPQIAKAQILAFKSQNAQLHTVPRAALEDGFTSEALPDLREERGNQGLSAAGL